jgi:hypothetical protein
MADLEPVPDDLRALLDEEKAGEDPSRDVRERVLLRLAGTFTAGGPAGLSPDAAAQGAPDSGSPDGAVSAPVLKVAGVASAARVVRTAVIFVTGAAAGVGGYHVVERSQRPAPVSAPAAPHADRPAPPPPPEVPTPAAPTVPDAVPNTASAPIRPRAPSAPEPTHGPLDRPDDPLAAERSLVEMARAALTRGQAERALAALRRHVRQFPNGELTEEREGLLVQALVGAERYDQAREKAEQFKKRYPRSLFAPVVDQAIGSIP